MSTTNLADLVFASALEQAKLVRSRQISPLELVELYLQRIEQFNPQLGCFYHLATETALADAKAKTEQLAQISDSAQLPPFFGVPTAIKDVNAVAGMPLSYGVAAFKEQVATADEGIVTKMKQAGFILLGKTATPQFASLPYTEAPGFMPARNPWQLDYTPGGSSGGGAAAVAAGLCSIAQGNDGGGSIRGPAFCCGLVGIKPSRGRVSYAPVGNHQNGISTHGTLARNVADAAALLDVISGYITGDPYWLPEPEIPFLGATQQQLPSLRIAFATSVPPVGKATETCRQGVKDIVNLLAEMGHIVEESCPDFTALIEPFKQIWSAGVASTGVSLELLSPMNRWIASQAGTAGEYLQAVMQMQIIARQIVSFFDRFDVLILPTYMHSPIRIGEWNDLNPEETFAKIVNWILPCPPFNASGQPAIAIPTGFDELGLPVGIQLIGKPAAETTIIALAAQIESAKPWVHHRPVDFS